MNYLISFEISWKTLQKRTLFYIFRQILVLSWTPVSVEVDNCSPRFKLRSSKKVWQAFVVDYLPDSLLQLLETFSNVFFYTFCQFLTPNLTRNIVQLLMKRKFLPELCQYYLEYAKNLAPLIFYLL